MIDKKLGYSKKTQKLIDKLCKIAERKSYILKKKYIEETILKTYDLFNLERPGKIIWYTHLTEEFLEMAYRASSAYSAYRASSAYRAYNASCASWAYSASSAYSASRASRASCASSAYSASRAYRDYRVSLAYRASSASWASRAYRASRASTDIDFDCSVCNFEYIENPDGEVTENDKKYFEYSKLVIKAKELGLGYFCDFEGTLYLVPAPIIFCDEQNRYHNENGPAIFWKDAEELYYLRGVRFEKEWWSKIIKDEMTPQEVFAIDNQEHRRVAYEYMDKTKMKQLDNFTTLDEIKDDGNGYPMKVVSFTVPNVKEPLKYLNCFCPTTGREYFIGTKEDRCKEAKTQSFGFFSTDLKFIKEW